MISISKSVTMQTFSPIVTYQQFCSLLSKSFFQKVSHNMEVFHTFLTVFNLLLTNIRKVKNAYFILLKWLDTVMTVNQTFLLKIYNSIVRLVLCALRNKEQKRIHIDQHGSITIIENIDWGSLFLSQVVVGFVYANWQSML